MRKTSTFCSCENTWGSTVCWLLTWLMSVIVSFQFCKTFRFYVAAVVQSYWNPNKKCASINKENTTYWLVHRWLNPVKVNIWIPSWVHRLSVSKWITVTQWEWHGYRLRSVRARLFCSDLLWQVAAVIGQMATCVNLFVQSLLLLLL